LEIKFGITPNTINEYIVMAGREIIKEYQNGDLVVVWKPKKCIHSGICVKTLPEVYNPNEKPWIKAENASVDELKAQIDKCPSGALSYYMKGAKKAEAASAPATRVEVASGGPLLVHGEIEITGTDGKVEKKKRTTAFCRCGASHNKPYCDGTHNKIDFSD
jgi:uncharacterized Fe-S cluster protein YjdI